VHHQAHPWRLTISSRNTPQDGSPGNGRPIPFFGHVLRASAHVAVAGLALFGCSTGSKSLSSDSTLGPLTSTTLAETTTTASVGSTSTTVTEATSTIPMSTLATPTTLAVATTVAATSPPETTLPPETTVPVDTTPATASPETSVPETTLPPPPQTTAPAPGCVACQPTYVFPYESHFTVPQLGTEPVRGTGCGADGSLGPTMPDGIWDGFIKISSTSLTIDVQCIYYGASAAPYVAACEAEHDADECLEFGDDFWMVNNNPRTRTVPLDPGFRRRFEIVGCTDPGPGKGTQPQSEEQPKLDSWLIIENGKATFALTSCIYG